MKKIILFLGILNLGIYAIIHMNGSQKDQSLYPLPEIHPEKIEILNQQAFDMVYQHQSAAEGR